MEVFSQDFEIRQIPLRIKSQRLMVEEFLQGFGLRLDKVDYYAGVFQVGSNLMLGGGGVEKDIIKCVAISEKLQDTGLGTRLISHLYLHALESGAESVRVFTKPKNQEIFQSLNFQTIASTKKAILLENGRGLKQYCNYLHEHRKEGKNGLIVINANPFTLGHRYLIQTASNQVDNLYIIPVWEDKSTFLYKERKAMIEQGTADLGNVQVLEGSPYSISAATFPTYFLKELTEATDTHIGLDLDLFINHIAKALKVDIRFAGSEPKDPLTCRYNQLMATTLPPNGLQFVEIARMEMEGQVVSASILRTYLLNKDLNSALKISPKSTWPYLLGYLASNSLQEELDTTPKPGLVDKEDCGSHSDMDYELMQQSIKTLRPFFMQLACEGFEYEQIPITRLQNIGIQAEKTMLEATHGVNTHKGALFSMGLAVVSAARLLYINELTAENLSKEISLLAQQFAQPTDTHGFEVQTKTGSKGALHNAMQGYKEVFDTYLPYYEQQKGDQHQNHKTLLKIMSILQDSNILYRKGEQGGDYCKGTARQLLENFSLSGLERLNRDFQKQNLSPGGAADMLALTMFFAAVLG